MTIRSHLNVLTADGKHEIIFFTAVKRVWEHDGDAVVEFTDGEVMKLAENFKEFKGTIDRWIK